MTLALVGQLLGAEGFRPGRLVIEGERVSSVEFGGRFRAADADLFLPDCLIGPGLIDLQVNGAAGRDFTADPAGLAEAAEFLPSTGVTAFLPTVISAPLEELIAGLRGLVGHGYWQPGQARVLGIHLEGPFLHPEFRRAHRAEFLRAASPDDLELLWEASSSRLRMVTLAPELHGAMDVLRALQRHGVIVSAGHSSATFEQANVAFDAGARFVAHIFNAQPPLHHRAPGLAGAALARPGLSIGLIADGVHVHPSVCALVHRCKGWRRIALTTDAVAALGQPAGRYTLAGQNIESDGTVARLSETGELAGGVVGLNQAVANMARFCDIDLAEAWRMASAVPGALLGQDDLGCLRPGARADVTVASPAMEVCLTLIRGVVAYRSRARI